MADVNNSSRLTSDYVLSPTTKLEIATTGGRLRESKYRQTSPSITSLTASDYVGPEIHESNLKSDLPPNPSSTDIQVSVNHDVKKASKKPTKNRPIFKLNALCVQALLYPITIVIYLLIGAAIFTAIEHDHENMVKASLNNEMQTIDELQQVVEAMLRNLNVSKSTSQEILNNFTSNFTKLCMTYSSSIHTPQDQWEFLPSFYFAATVITTIGYGHTSPRTSSGRAFLCVYALMGIPLMIVCLITIGRYLSGAWDTIVSHIRSKNSRLNKYKDIHSFILLAVIGFNLVVLIPAIIFQQIEPHWSYGDAVYFAIVSLTTVGLGDFTPAAEHLKELRYIVLYLTWLIFGFSIVSVLVTKMSGFYTRVNKSLIVRSKRYFRKCLRVKKNDRLPLIDEYNKSMEEANL